MRVRCSLPPAGLSRDGTGLIGWATQCGRNEIVGTPLQGKVSSVKTHGNAVTFYNYNNPWFSVAEVGPWTQTNLSPKENDSPDWMYVDC
ncbi:hypothetical protein KY5_6650c [Streptomyces formicae]|uniref:Uncharacterized protein n=1 Tax=Streptomyces formicae TaxID=1616117 RepID=A0A291QJD5_9ACTN|nr:hypothetical protein KY5_6650c [Streptomyces formicae]